MDIKRNKESISIIFCNMITDKVFFFYFIFREFDLNLSMNCFFRFPHFFPNQFFIYSYYLPVYSTNTFFKAYSQLIVKITLKYHKIKFFQNKKELVKIHIKKCFFRCYWDYDGVTNKYSYNRWDEKKIYCPKTDFMFFFLRNIKPLQVFLYR